MVTPGRLLGAGGEAFVRETQEDSKFATEVYWQPNGEREQKVLAMISRPTSNLCRFVARTSANPPQDISIYIKPGTHSS